MLRSDYYLHIPQEDSKLHDFMRVEKSSSFVRCVRGNVKQWIKLLLLHCDYLHWTIIYWWILMEMCISVEHAFWFSFLLEQYNSELPLTNFLLLMNLPFTVYSVDCQEIVHHNFPVIIYEILRICNHAIDLCVCKSVCIYTQYTLDANICTLGSERLR